MKTTRTSLLQRVKDFADRRAWPQSNNLYSPLSYRYPWARGLPRDAAEEVRDQCPEVVTRKMPGLAYSKHKGGFKNWVVVILTGLPCYIAHGDPSTSADKPLLCDTPAAFPFDESFASSPIGQHWVTRSTATGRIRLIPGPNECGTGQRVIMDSAQDGSYSRNELILCVDLSAAKDIQLSVAVTSFNDDFHLLPAIYPDSINGDGVAVSDDLGATWHRVADFSDIASGMCKIQFVDLDLFASTVGLSLTSRFLIKFQQFDNMAVAPTGGDGVALDNVVLTASQPCESSSQCDDGLQCTDDVCDRGECIYAVNFANCDDGLFCNGQESCLNRQCVTGQPECRGCSEITYCDAGLPPSSVRWISRGAGLWGDSINWLPSRVPGEDDFAIIAAEDAEVSLNVDVRVRGMHVGGAAKIQVDPVQSRAGRSLVAERVENQGTIVVTGGASLRLVGDVRQTKGTLYARGDGSTFRMTGSRISGGRLLTTGDARFELVESSVMDVALVRTEVLEVGSVEVPNTDVEDDSVSEMGGSIRNESQIVIVGQTSLRPTSGVFGAPLDIAGGGNIVLTDAASSKLGDETGLTTIVNRIGHRVEGAGAITGTFENEGTIRANINGESLILVGGGTKTNSNILQAEKGGRLLVIDRITQSRTGRLEAKDGGSVLIQADIDGTGGLSADGGEIRLERVMVSLGTCVDVPPPGMGFQSRVAILDSTVTATTATASNDMDITGGTVSVSQNSRVTFAGPVSIRPAPGAVAALGLTDSLFSAGQLGVGKGGGLSVVDSTLAVVGSFTFENTNGSDWIWGTAAVLEMAGGLGLPDDDPAGYSQLEVGGVDFGVDPAGHIGHPDGFDDNFDLTILSIGPGAHVSLVDFINNGNRIDHGFGLDEALYVDTLRFQDANGRLNLDGLHLYYATLAGDPSQIVDLPRPRADYDIDCDVDLADFAAFQNCFGQSPVHFACRAFDADATGSIERADFGMINGHMIGPGCD